MNDHALPKRDQLAATYLQQLQALAFEITVATDAIAANALAKFQESVSKQEMLCATLAAMASTVSDGFRPSDQSSLPGIDPQVQSKIRAAHGSIRKLNLQYAALLKHSGRSIALLSSLCRSYTGQYQEARGPRSKRQTWSCEM
jgi:hypothetical protein